MQKILEYLYLINKDKNTLDPNSPFCKGLDYYPKFKEDLYNKYKETTTSKIFLPDISNKTDTGEFSNSWLAGIIDGFDGKFSIFNDKLSLVIKCQFTKQIPILDYIKSYYGGLVINDHYYLNDNEIILNLINNTKNYIRTLRVRKDLKKIDKILGSNLNIYHQPEYIINLEDDWLAGFIDSSTNLFYDTHFGWVKLFIYQNKKTILNELSTLIPEGYLFTLKDVPYPHVYLLEEQAIIYYLATKYINNHLLISEEKSKWNEVELAIFINTYPPAAFERPLHMKGLELLSCISKV
jgi:hypothetical protein